MRTADLRARQQDAWRTAAKQPFVDAIGAGTLPEYAFAAWLAQDYHFVGDLLVFQAQLLARAPRSAQAALAGGLVAAEAELTWFEALAAEHRLDLRQPRRPATDAYAALLRQLAQAPYPVAITALWAIERAYLEAWHNAAPGAERFRPFVEHWTVPAFAEYVASLERAADAALAATAEGEPAATEAAEACAQVMALERAFWQMAWEADAT